MNCRDARARLDPFLDGELEMGENVELSGHVETCSACTSIFEGERRLFDEIRRQAAGPAAPVGLRERIGREIERARAPAPAPWPFARALVPAAAAAVLVAIFASVFTPAPERLDAESLARRAVAWHDGRPDRLFTATAAPELASYFGDQGQKSCIHERLVNAGMNYAYKAACVQSAGPAGSVTCWWIAGCPVSGHRMSHARFPVSAALETVLAGGERRTIVIGDRAVVLNAQKGFV